MGDIRVGVHGGVTCNLGDFNSYRVDFEIMGIDPDGDVQAQIDAAMPHIETLREAVLTELDKEIGEATGYHLVRGSK